MAPAGTATGSASGGSTVHDDAEAMELGHDNLIRRRHAGAGAAGGEADDRIGSAAAAAGKEVAPLSVEQAFADQPVPSWREQLTVRAFVVGALLSVVFNVILMKIDLTTGINPSLNVCASLLSYFLLRTWTRAIGCMGLLKQPFTRQENTMIQTCVVSAYGITFTGKINPKSAKPALICSSNFIPETRSVNHPAQVIFGFQIKSTLNLC